MIERELAPSLFVIAFCISVSGYYVPGALFTVILLLAAGYLGWAYMGQRSTHVIFGRAVVFAVTVMLFITVLADDHAFEDSTLPQLIENHMTNLARSRHGDDRININTGELKTEEESGDDEDGGYSEKNEKSKDDKKGGD